MKKIEIDYLEFFKAVKHGSVTKVRDFIRAGADIHYINNSQQLPSIIHYNPLMVAAKYNKIKICNILLQHGAESSLKPHLIYGYYAPILQSIINNNKELFLLFLDHDKSLKEIPSECFYQSQFTNEWYDEVLNRNFSLHFSVIVRHLVDQVKSPVIEFIIKRKEPVLEDLLNIVMKMRTHMPYCEYYMNLIEQHVPADSLKTVLSSLNSDIKGDSSIYKRLQVITEKKLLNNSIEQSPNIKSFKI